ncbi:hypothetical protein [Kitasatospora sp. NPDC059827]|uniref:hypothetical protein n=1 Tax=Kitasatospora sp. NPDC059827 TaxID=3346964 RepID=UPI003651AED4
MSPGGFDFDGDAVYYIGNIEHIENWTSSGSVEHRKVSAVAEAPGCSAVPLYPDEVAVCDLTRTLPDGPSAAPYVAFMEQVMACSEATPQERAEILARLEVLVRESRQPVGSREGMREKVQALVEKATPFVPLATAALELARTLSG